jgi:hypothetical protein
MCIRGRPTSPPHAPCALLPNLETDTGLEGAELGGVRPYYVQGRQLVGGALLDFTVPYLYDPHTEA